MLGVFKVDYLEKEDAREWLLNLEKYSKIKDFTLSKMDVEKIWDTVGGSMWEIQAILTGLFENTIDDVLDRYKMKIKGLIEYNIGADIQKEKTLKVFLKQDTARLRDFISAGITPALS